MNILHTIAGGPVGGAERFFVDLAVAFKNEGHKSQAVMRPNEARGRLLDEAGVPHTDVPFGRWLDFKTTRTIRATARKMNADIVMSWMGRASRATPKGPYGRVARHGGYYNYKSFRGFDAQICNTPDLVRYLTDGGFDPATVHFIPNFTPVDPRPALARSDFDTPEDATLLLAMGRLHDAKAFDVTLDALAATPGAYLWIAGAGPLEADLKNQARELGLGSRVRWLGWRDDPGRLLRTADICVFPSRVEPFGNVIIAAWAHGTPVITANATGPEWLVRPGEDALLVPRDNAPAVAAAIAQLTSDKALAARLVAAGAKRAKAEFSQSACLERYLSVFRQVQEARA
ncbi:Glycosyl transferase/GT4 [Candidatus Phaeomarinobacter ectocarpi]|uniref:Glycosyl transferase/GT4 n=1 Tax=Candidatus Phaeomarinibacter ectocarpi TaxID=1458461 RepID=X5M9Y7_9HYPH|nr:glycosyltransferase [Candidatus Phaeomarinobacter ectocarpi]CDO60503.1 Glycosyl transferase/GT4 [Candidatus Phaeomarinobacter ectocarpi]